MDSINVQYRNIVEKVMQDYIDFLGSDDQAQAELVFDGDRNHYLLVETGWQNGYRIYGTLLHYVVTISAYMLRRHISKSRAKVNLLSDILALDE